MAYPTLILKAAVPPSYATFVNGSPPADKLRDPGDGRGPLLIEPSYGMQALHILARRHGFVVETTGRGRSLKAQTDAFLIRMTPTFSSAVNTSQHSRVCKLDQRNIHPDLYPGKRWYLKLGYAPVAAPGTSPHGLYVADDLSEENDADPATDPISEALVRFLVTDNLLGRLGFAWSLQIEPWHVQWIAGDVLPPLVRQILTEEGIPFPGSPGTNPPPPGGPIVFQRFQPDDRRVYDSRIGNPPPGKWRDGVTQTLPLFNVPDGALGVAVKMTCTDIDDVGGEGGFMAVWSTGEHPGTSIQGLFRCPSIAGTKNVALTNNSFKAMIAGCNANVIIDIEGWWLV